MPATGRVCGWACQAGRAIYLYRSLLLRQSRARLGAFLSARYIPPMDLPDFYAGQMLLAMPGIGDPNFDHSAILLCAHDAGGAMGIDMGAEVEGLGLRALLATFGIDGSAIPDDPVLRGGPVEPRRGFVLHSLDWGGQDMVRIDDKWGLSGTLDVLKAIAERRGPRRYRVALGYAGWGPGQLEGEMTRHGWLMTPANARLLFDTPAERIWSASFAAIGVDTTLLSSRAGSA